VVGSFSDSIITNKISLKIGQYLTKLNKVCRFFAPSVYLNKKTRNFAINFRPGGQNHSMLKTVSIALGMLDLNDFIAKSAIVLILTSK